MKLLSKLAETYASCYIDPVDGKSVCNVDAYMGFIAGFEKAREMAAKIAYSPDFDGTGDELDCIGEEEV